MRDFLLSAVEILSHTGHIRVALAAGQGGTLVDKPRLWGDTWQVSQLLVIIIIYELLLLFISYYQY